MPPAKSPKTRPQYPNAYAQAIEIQDLLRSNAKSKAIKGVALASLARAWLDLERLKREIRMLPKPKAVDVLPRSRGKRSPSAFSEPISAAKKPPPHGAGEPTPAETGPANAISADDSMTTSAGGEPEEKGIS